MDAVRNEMTQMTQSSKTSADEIMKKRFEAIEGINQRIEDGYTKHWWCFVKVEYRTDWRGEG